MSVICPKCGHVRSNDDDPLIPDWKCPACGIAYGKIINNKIANPNPGISRAPFNYKKVLITSAILTVAFVAGTVAFVSYQQLKIDEENKNIAAKRLQAEEKKEQRRQRIAAQNAELEKIKTARELECSDDAACIFYKLKNMPQLICQENVERQSKWTFKWTDEGWLTKKFDHIVWEDESKSTIVAAGDHIQFQNAFGAWADIKYYCFVDAKSGNIKAIKIQQGRF